MKKIAYLILAHSKADICNLLIEELLRDERCDVYLHLDIKAKTPELFRKDVVWVKRYDVHWGGASMVYATLELIREAYVHDYNRYVLLSGDSFPVLDIIKINDSLLESDDVDFMELYKNKLGERGYDRIYRYWLFENHINKVCWWLNKKAVEFQKKVGYSREFPYDIKDYKLGVQWWGLSDKSIKEIIKKCDNKIYKRFIKHTKIPDEFFVQNAVENENIKDNLIYYTYVYSEAGTYQGVKELQEIDVEICLESGRMFARKVSKSFISAIRKTWR